MSEPVANQSGPGFRRAVSRWEIVGFVRQRRDRQRGVPAAGRGRGDPRPDERVGGDPGRVRGAAAGALLRRGRQLLRPAGRRVHLSKGGLRRAGRVRGRLDDVARPRVVRGVALGRVRPGARLPLAADAGGDRADARDHPAASAADRDQHRGGQVGGADGGVPGDHEDTAAGGVHRRRPVRDVVDARRGTYSAQTARWGRRYCFCSSPTRGSRTPRRRPASSRTHSGTCRSPWSCRSSW